MREIQWQISAGAVLCIALAYFFDESGLLSALVPAALAHELGHVVALRLFGARVRRVSVGLFGLEIDYSGLPEGGRTCLSLLAGPAAGLLYAVAASHMPSGFWQLSGAVSFLLSAFNLLPVLPLDGGRMLARLLEQKWAVRISRVTAAAILLFGAVLLFLSGAVSALMMGAWLMIYNGKE